MVAQPHRDSLLPRSGGTPKFLLQVVRQLEQRVCAATCVEQHVLAKLVPALDALVVEHLCHPVRPPGAVEEAARVFVIKVDAVVVLELADARRFGPPDDASDLD